MSERGDYGVVHLAGPDVTVDGRFVRQLCSWCGARLVDLDLARVYVVEVNGSRGPSRWEPGSWVRVRERGKLTSYDVVRLSDGERYPEESCMAVEAATLAKVGQVEH